MSDCAGRRAADLSARRAALAAALSGLSRREAAAAAAVRSAAAECAAAVSRREAELLAALRADCALQRAALEGARAEVSRREAELLAALRGPRANDGTNASEANGAADVPALLRASAHFDVPDVFCYTVTAAPLQAERYISLTRTHAAPPVPPALTAPPTAHVPLSALSISTPTEIPRGALHCIGTAGHTRPFRNPIDAGLVRVRSTAPVVSGHLAALCDTTKEAALQCVRTASAEGARVELDLGEERGVECEAYAIRHGSAETHVALRSWRLLASRDGAQWIVLDERKRNRTLGSTPFNVATFDIDRERVLAQTETVSHGGSRLCNAFRYFALELAGPDAVGEYHIEISGLEFYGSLIGISTLCEKDE